MSTEKYDVVIIGGGMVGGTLACALQTACGEAPAAILVVEAAVSGAPTGPPSQPAFDARSTAISQGSMEYLRELGLWDEALDPCPIHTIHVSDRGRFGAVRMDCREHGMEVLGSVVENASLGSRLNRAVAEAGSVTFRDGTEVSALVPTASGARLELKDSRGITEVETALVVLAEGGRSELCARLGIARHTKSYGQTAIVTNIGFEVPHGHTAYERFTPEGPLALLPLNPVEGQNRAALVWTLKDETAVEMMTADDEDFLTALQQAFGFRAGRFLRAGKRHAYPLKRVRAEEQYRSGLVLLGNVAQSLHPVAGQGFNLALRNTMKLAEIVGGALRRGEDPGAIRHLQTYSMAVDRDQEKTLLFSDGLIRLFSADSNLMACTRTLGLISIDLLPPLKHELVRQAAGVGAARARIRSI